MTAPEAEVEIVAELAVDELVDRSRELVDEDVGLLVRQHVVLDGSVGVLADRIAECLLEPGYGFASEHRAKTAHPRTATGAAPTALPLAAGHSPQFAASLTTRRVSRSEGAPAFGYTAAQIIAAGRAGGSPLLMIR